MDDCCQGNQLTHTILSRNRFWHYYSGKSCLWSAKCKNIHKITWLVSIPSVYYPLLLLRSNSCCIISFYIPYIKSVLNNSIVIAYFLIYIACFIKLLLLLLIKYMLLAVIVVACEFAKNLIPSPWQRNIP